MQTIRDRLTEFIKYTGKSVRAFEIDCGMSNGAVKGIRDTLTAKMIKKIVLNYPELNMSWLTFGEGEMLLTEPIEIQTPPAVETADGALSYPVPLLPLHAQAGSLNNFTTAVRPTDCEVVYSPISGVDFAITVYGNSMAPEVPSGAKLLIKKIDADAFIEWGKEYVLDTCNGTIFKRVLPADASDAVVCHSNNPAFPPFTVRRSDIFGVYRVLLVMTQL